MASRAAGPPSDPSVTYSNIASPLSVCFCQPCQLSGQLSSPTRGGSSGGGGASLGLQSVNSVATAEADDDPDFADWDAAEGGASVAVSAQSPGAATTMSGGGASSPLPSARAYSNRSAAPEPEATPPPPPEPDYFGSLGMGIDSSGVQVTRVAAKRPLPSALAAAAASGSALRNPNNNLYADVAAASASNAHSSRFLDDLVDEDADGASAVAAGWGDDLGSLEGLGSPAGTGASPDADATRAAGSRKKGAAQAPREKKPRGIGAVAVALDGE